MWKCLAVVVAQQSTRDRLEVKAASITLISSSYSFIEAVRRGV
jgi:hypothetical protein